MKLTNENIKAAIDFTENGLEDLQRRYPILINANVIRTILAALDACRWRDAKTELPEPHKLVLSSHNTLMYIDRDGLWYDNECDEFSTGTPEAWLPLPEWEG